VAQGQFQRERGKDLECRHRIGCVVKSGLFGIWLDRYLHLWSCGQHSGHSYQLHSGEQEGPCIHFQVGTVTSGVGIRSNDIYIYNDIYIVYMQHVSDMEQLEQWKY